MNVAKRILGLILVLIGFYVTLAIGGASTRIMCEQVEPGQVDCTTQPAPLGIAAGKKRTHHNVLKAYARDYGGLGQSFVLELETLDGTDSLSGDMTVNEQAAAERINAFLRDPRKDALVINDVDWGHLVIGMLFVGGFVGIYPGLYLLFAGFWHKLFRRINWLLVGGMACALFGIFVLFIFGRVTTVTCRHVEPTHIDCHQQESWAGLIPLSQPHVIRDVEKADADRRRSSNPSAGGLSSYSHHFRLRTADGRISAIECFTFPQAKEMARKVNDFIASDEAGTLQINNFHWVSTTLGLACIIVPCAILGTFALARYFLDKRRRNGQ
jgi:hypothetical protein